MDTNHDQRQPAGRRRPAGTGNARPTLPPLPLRPDDIGRELLGLAFLLDSGLRSGFIADLWTGNGPTEMSLRGEYRLSECEALLLRIALSIDHRGSGVSDDLFLIVNRLSCEQRLVTAFTALLQALCGGNRVQVLYCTRIFTEASAPQAEPAR